MDDPPILSKRHPLAISGLRVIRSLAVKPSVRNSAHAGHQKVIAIAEFAIANGCQF